MSTLKENQFFIWEEKNLTEQLPKLENKETSVPNDTTGSIRKNVTENEWKDTIPTVREKVSGIYKIINKVNGKYYIGNTTKLGNRWCQHKGSLKYQRHVNSHLQSAWNKYGGNNFNFVIVEKVLLDKLVVTEQKYLDIAKNEQDKCYNQNFSANSVLQTEEMKEKIRNTLKKYYMTHKSPMYGKTLSAESIEKMKKTKTGVKQSEEHKHNISKSLKGIIRNNETKRKMSLCKTGKNSPLYDFTIYEWYNENTKELFKGTQYDFYTNYGFSSGSVSYIVNGKRNSLYGWKVRRLTNNKNMIPLNP
jgi:group I intron endonuclease